MSFFGEWNVISVLSVAVLFVILDGFQDSILEILGYVNYLRGLVGLRFIIYYGQSIRALLK